MVAASGRTVTAPHHTFWEVRMMIGAQVRASMFLVNLGAQAVPPAAPAGGDVFANPQPSLAGLPPGVQTKTNQLLGWIVYGVLAFIIAGIMFAAVKIAYSRHSHRPGAEYEG